MRPASDTKCRVDCGSSSLAPFKEEEKPGIAAVSPGFLYAQRMTSLEHAWAKLDAANTMGWAVGRPSLHDEVRGAEHWEQSAHEAREKAKAGKRLWEITATGSTEVD